MKKTQWIELFRTIRKTKVTFIAIILFVTMGMAFFFGIAWSGDSIEASANDFFVKGSLADLDLQSVYGFDEPFVAEVGSLDGVKNAEGYYQAYEFLSHGGKTYEVRITSLTEECNKPLQITGTVPEKCGEIAVEGSWAKEHGVSVGDQIVFSHDGGAPDDLLAVINSEAADLPAALAEPGGTVDSDGMNYLRTDTFTVTAVIETAPYLSNSADMYGVSYPDAIPVNCLMFADPSSFDESAFPGYTNIAIKMAETEEKDYFSEGHQLQLHKLKDRLISFTSAYTDAKNEKLAEKKQLLEALGMDYAETIPAYSCSISTSEDNPSVIGIRMMSTIFEKLRYSMAGLFVIIGLLVCFFTVSRIAYESTALIGTKKALGFTQKEITGTYLLYAGLAAIVGSVCSALGARFIVEPILLTAIRGVYQFDSILYTFEILPAVLFGLFELVVQMLAVYLACRSIFKKETLLLLNGGEASSAKKRFYEKTHLWKKLSLYSKTIINNFFADKRRVFSTVIGVAACSSLVVCALTLNNHILGSFDRQYRDVYGFDGIVYFDADAERDEIASVLAKNGINYTEVYSTHVALSSPSGKSIATYLYVTEKDDFEKIMHIADLDGESTFDGGFWCSCSYAEEFDAVPGDVLTFTDEAKAVHHICADGFFEYYLINNLIVTDAQSFRAEFHRDYAPNTYFISSGGCNFDTLSDELSECEGFIYLSNDYEVSKTSFDGFADVFSIIVTVYLVLAVAMALLVLLNLFVMFVSEKKRELLTMLVNGYGVRDAKRYIWLDTLILTVVGILIGLVFGTVMADISLEAYKNETIYFMSGIDWKACLIGIAVSALLSIGTAMIALYRIEKFKLTEINAQ